jgi:hypothetical protein
MIGLEGRPERFLGLFHCLPRRNIEFAYPYPSRDSYSIYHPSTTYQTTEYYTVYTSPSQLYLDMYRNR